MSGPNSAENTARVAVFTTEGCPYCKRAKETLRGKGVEFEEIDVSGDDALRAQLREVTGKRTVPQIFLAGTPLGGSDELLALVAAGGFDKRLSTALAAQAPALPPALCAAVLSAKHTAAEAEAETAADREEAGAPGAAGSLALQELAGAMADTATGVPRGAAPVPGCGAPQPAVFSGSQALDWLQAAGGAPSRGAALALARQLVLENLVTLVSDRPPAPEEQAGLVDDAVPRYRLRSDAPPPQLGRPLNAHYWWAGPARPAEKVAEDLRRRILGLYNAHLSADGRKVSYSAIRKDPEFWAFVDATAELQAVDLTPLSRESLMALMINIYNAMVVHALVVHGAEQLESTLKRLNFFSQAVRYNIGGSEYVADDVENGVLRGNRASAAAVGVLVPLLGALLPQLKRGPFGQGDPRLKKVVSPVDARIHFALVCGAKSCPPIKLYTASNLDEGLDAAAEAFCETEVEIDPAASAVRLSKIFKWYSVDFGGSKEERLRFLLPHLAPPRRAQLQAMLDSGRDISVDYLEYNWSVNSD